MLHPLNISATIICQLPLILGEVISFMRGTECTVVNTFDTQLFGIIDDKIYLLLKIEKQEPKAYQKVEVDKRHVGHKPSENHPWKRNMMLKH